MAKEMKLVLSSDAKPRLKWTSELHQRFIDAVDRLGEATPKSLMRKYRMGKNQAWQNYHQNKEEEDGEKQRSHIPSNNSDGAKDHINDLQITQALQMQMEVQRKLHEQIEVQRHLQLRIEAQGKYLQSVLKKAQETISEYSSCSIEVEQAKARLSQLMSMVDSECPNSSFSVLTQSEGSMSENEKNRFLGHNGCSIESSLTSSESSWRNEETPNVDENYNHTEQSSSKRLRLMEKIDLNCKIPE
ncbi:hypothetical protein DH2020_049919 [Rehmannia glutinosa]|uniref:MYB-CC type transcription factor LHEQLE-containing domain-containing protein n=1 Tax=Rehmannia glutinosa TaxID=99300 RepID=A0ABR0U2I9_REHGL